jgi:hypothetical protein
MLFSLAGVIAISSAFPVHIPFGAVFIRAFVARHTVADIIDTFFVMFCGHAGDSVFVAAVAGVGGVVIVAMADYAFGIVVTVEDKIIVVCKGRWNPLRGAVAFIAIVRSLLMESICRHFVAGSAVVFNTCLEVVMIEWG